jgi:acyl dehydratase
LQRLDVRFSAPVYPGETFEISIWKEPGGRAFVEASVVERGLTVLKGGYVEYRDDGADE